MIQNQDCPSDSPNNNMHEHISKSLSLSRPFYWPSPVDTQSPGSLFLQASAPAWPLSSSTAPPRTPAAWHCNTHTVHTCCINACVEIFDWIPRYSLNLLIVCFTVSLIYFLWTIVFFVCYHSLTNCLTSDNAMWRPCLKCNCTRAHVMEVVSGQS